MDRNACSGRFSTPHEGDFSGASDAVSVSVTPGIFGAPVMLVFMVRKVETIVSLSDDLDGSKADRTVTFAVNGTSYEIDLSKRNAAAFDKALAPYLGAARKIKATRTRTRSTDQAPGRRSDQATIRQWARANGYQVADRGRIPAAVIDGYRSAH